MNFATRIEQFDRFKSGEVSDVLLTDLVLDTPPVDGALELGTVFYIVGDKFRNFSDNNIVLAYSEALENLDIIARIARRVVFCQGVGAEKMRYFDDLLRAKSGSRTIDIAERIRQKVASELVQKTDDREVMISAPEAESPFCFRSSLVIDEDCAEMREQGRIEHLHGSLLVEAARQMFMASVRSYNLVPAPATPLTELKFAFNSIEVRFDNFVFPLAADLRLQITGVISQAASTSAAAVIRIFQLNRPCCEVKFQAGAYSRHGFDNMLLRDALKVRQRLEVVDLLA